MEEDTTIKINIFQKEKKNLNVINDQVEVFHRVKAFKIT